MGLRVNGRLSGLVYSLAKVLVVAFSNAYGHCGSTLKFQGIIFGFRECV